VVLVAPQPEHARCARFASIPPRRLVFNSQIKCFSSGGVVVETKGKQRRVAFFYIPLAKEMRKTNRIPIKMEIVLNAGKIERAQRKNGNNTCFLASASGA
jgi:hypothetical protein